MKEATVKNGEEKWEEYVKPYVRRGECDNRVQYDYRHTDGELFSCVRYTLEDCREAKDKWLKGKL